WYAITRWGLLITSRAMPITSTEAKERARAPRKVHAGCGLLSVKSQNVKKCEDWWRMRCLL
ncbi:MAG: hypothetical protein J2P53_04440, partial [Bradyrhizobiaceae bacterium]|nr:hypothetical protein [Bradyrhizobiaceae bacterium]